MALDDCAASDGAARTPAPAGPVAGAARGTRPGDSASNGNNAELMQSAASVEVRTAPGGPWYVAHAEPTPATPAAGSPTTYTGQTQQTQQDAEAPELRAWVWTENNMLRGRVYGQDGVLGGQKVKTSKIVECSPVSTTSSTLEDLGQPAEAHFHVLTPESAAALGEGALVRTRNRVYRLGAPYSATAPSQAVPAPGAPPPVRVEPAAKEMAPAPHSSPGAHASGLGWGLPRDTELARAAPATLVMGARPRPVVAADVLDAAQTADELEDEEDAEVHYYICEHRSSLSKCLSLSLSIYIYIY